MNTDTSYFMCNNWDRRIFLVDLNLQSNDLHQCRTQKIVMDPWQAPYQNSKSYWCFTYGQKRSDCNFVLTSVIFTISTQCYTKGSHTEGEPQTNLRCCVHSPVILHPFLGAEQTLQWCVLKNVKGQPQIPTLLHIKIHVTETGFTLCHSPDYRRKDKFCNSCIKTQNWTTQFP